VIALVACRGLESDRLRDLTKSFWQLFCRDIRSLWGASPFDFRRPAKSVDSSESKGRGHRADPQPDPRVPWIGFACGSRYNDSTASASTISSGSASFGPIQGRRTLRLPTIAHERLDYMTFKNGVP
jgi:hypothetical protein